MVIGSGGDVGVGTGVGVDVGVAGRVRGEKATANPVGVGRGETGVGV